MNKIIHFIPPIIKPAANEVAMKEVGLAGRTARGEPPTNPYPFVGPYSIANLWQERNNYIKDRGKCYLFSLSSYAIMVKVLVCIKGFASYVRIIT